MKDTQYILVFNSGSSSFKFALFQLDELNSVISGSASCLNTESAIIELRDSGQAKEKRLPGADHRMAIDQLLSLLAEEFNASLTQIAVAGHRVVHGGEYFHSSVLIDENVIASIRECVALAPLHNPASLVGIEALRQLQPALPQVAVFDTAFHQTLPKKAFLYALPYELYHQHRVRRYGFHGTSHRYVSQRAVAELKLPIDDHQLLVAHLGNGCSATAIVNGKSVDTTMGLTPLEGLVMGTRSGDVDPGLHHYLHDQLGWDLQTTTEMLNKKSGLLGVSGVSHDMRSVFEQASRGHVRAKQAFELFCFRAAKALAALAASLTRIDALIFTGGIGEHHSESRAEILRQLHILGFRLDEQRNRRHGRGTQGIISTAESVCAMVIPTDEERMIAEDCKVLLADD